MNFLGRYSHFEVDSHIWLVVSESADIPVIPESSNRKQHVGNHLSSGMHE